MATVAASPAERRSAERKFYSRMALFLVAVVFLGFAPSFYLRGNVPSYPRPNPTLPPAVLLHGSLFTLWMLVFVAQTQLVSAGRLEMHMKLGKLDRSLALAIIPMMYLVGVWQVARANQPPFTDPLNWSVVPLAAIPAYAIMLWVGWTRRKEAQWHKRAMLSAAILVVMARRSAGCRCPADPGGFALTGACRSPLSFRCWCGTSAGSATFTGSTRLGVASPRLGLLFRSHLPRHRHLGPDRAVSCRGLGAKPPAPCAASLRRHRLDDLQRLVRRQRRAFLPQPDVAQMLAGEDDRAFGLQ